MIVEQSHYEKTLEKITRESSEQCRQVYFPTIHDEISLSELLSQSYNNSVLVYADFDVINTINLEEHIRLQPIKLF